MVEEEFCFSGTGNSAQSGDRGQRNGGRQLLAHYRAPGDVSQPALVLIADQQLIVPWAVRPMVVGLSLPSPPLTSIRSRSPLVSASCTRSFAW